MILLDYPGLSLRLQLLFDPAQVLTCGLPGQPLSVQLTGQVLVALPQLGRGVGQRLVGVAQCLQMDLGCLERRSGLSRGRGGTKGDQSDRRDRFEYSDHRDQ